MRGAASLGSRSDHNAVVTQKKKRKIPLLSTSSRVGESQLGSLQTTQYHHGTVLREKDPAFSDGDFFGLGLDSSAGTSRRQRASVVAWATQTVRRKEQTPAR